MDFSFLWSVLQGQVPTHLIGTDAFQECDTNRYNKTMPLSINWLVKDVKKTIINYA